MRTIEQSIAFKATPSDVYAALMDSAKHAEFSGAAADIGSRIGDPMSAYDGHITGRNIELVPGHRIVQAWRADEEGWSENHFSTVTFDLEAIRHGTRLHFTQSDVPDESADAIAQGWQDHYWSAMKEAFGW